MNAHCRHTIAFNKWAWMMCVWGVAVVILLAATSSAEAQGFNVNTDVTFTPLASTYQTTTSVTGCPAGFSGKMTFTALLTNTPESPAMPDVTVRVVTLTNGNLLLDPQTNQVLGGEGAEMPVPRAGQYADGLLGPGESVNVPFALCLKTFQPFQFFVDVYGVVTRLVSINRFGTGSGNNVSQDPVSSADGRFVAFMSRASDLTANGIYGRADVFVRDLQMETTTLVNINRFGTGTGNGQSTSHAISADGRFVAFTSDASDLTANDTNRHADVFVRNLQLGTTTLVSVNRDGTGSGNFDSSGPVISADGRFVVFGSGASDLTVNDTNSHIDVFVRDLQMGTTMLVSVNRFGTSSGNGESFSPVISADARFVAFTSDASDLTANDTNGTGRDVFVRDLQRGTTTLVSSNRLGTGTGNSDSLSPVVSADGRFVAFESCASDLTADNSNNGTSSPISNCPAGFGSDVFVRDLQMGTTTLVSINGFGASSGNANSFSPAISADGQFVAFPSCASDLTADDSNNGTSSPFPICPAGFGSDVFVRDLQMGTTTLVSINRLGTGSGNSDSSPFQSPKMSANGRFVVFVSNASDLTATSDSNFFDVFVRDLQRGTTTLLSINRLGTGSGNDGSSNAVISADGRFVAFTSSASDLVTNDTNGSGPSGGDVFVRPVAP